MLFYIQASTQLASSPKCPASRKKEYTKSVVWASTQVITKNGDNFCLTCCIDIFFQITKQYEAKLQQKPPTGMLETLIGQLQLT
jgi:hypothetical protein